MSGAPRVVIPARFSASASALRYRAIVTARALSEAVVLAGGEPLTVHPWAPGGDAGDLEARFGFADAVLLPGGGDLDPARYGQPVASDHVYDVDAEQDDFDLAVARWAWDSGRPLLAVCRGLQVVNVDRGGDLVQHMDDPHRHVVHTVTVDSGSRVLGPAIGGHGFTASCYHHQEIGRLGDGLRAVATAEDGVIEAVEGDRSHWFLGVQWHPEDTAADDPQQLGLLRAFVDAAR